MSSRDVAMSDYDSHGSPPQAQQIPQQQTTSLAVASFILGLVSLIPVVGWVTAVLAIIFGSLRLRKGSAGHGFAVAGFTLGVICLIGWVAWIVAIAAQPGG